MVSTRRKRADVAVAVASENVDNDINISYKNEESVKGYEEFRERRIKENKERLQKLGIFELTLKLKSKSRPTKETSRNVSSLKKKEPPNPLPLSASPRRSSRLKSRTPVNYSELRTKAKKRSAEDLEIRLQEGSKPEVYTEEHEKLLGNCKTTWTLFVDGYGKDGKRIYDPENGETCHQCRQKTLGHHTHCCKCNCVQGQFCGDCLYMRYGENVIEVSENPNWICPVCRGICNCSICRKAKGLAPTGSLYRKVTKLGFKSVAHYLIQTRRSQIHSEDSESDVQILDSEGRELSPADKGSQHLTHESLYADEHQDGEPDLQLNDNEVEMEEEEEKQVYCSGGSKYVGINDGCDDIDGDNSVDNSNGQKENIENMVGDNDNELKERQRKHEHAGI